MAWVGEAEGLGTGEGSAHRVNTRFRGEKMPSGSLVSMLSYSDLGRGGGEYTGREGLGTYRRRRLDWSLKRSLGKQESAFLLSSLKRKVIWVNMGKFTRWE